MPPMFGLLCFSCVVCNGCTVRWLWIMFCAITDAKCDLCCVIQKDAACDHDVKGCPLDPISILAGTPRDVRSSSNGHEDTCK